MIVLPILTNSLIHFSLKGWGNVLFELGGLTCVLFAKRLFETTLLHRCSEDRPLDSDSLNVIPPLKVGQHNHA